MTEKRVWSRLSRPLFRGMPFYTSGVVCDVFVVHRIVPYGVTRGVFSLLVCREGKQRYLHQCVSGINFLSPMERNFVFILLSELTKVVTTVRRFGYSGLTRGRGYTRSVISSSELGFVWVSRWLGVCLSEMSVCWCQCNFSPRGRLRPTHLSQAVRRSTLSPAPKSSYFTSFSVCSV